METKLDFLSMQKNSLFQAFLVSFWANPTILTRSKMTLKIFLWWSYGVQNYQWIRIRYCYSHFRARIVVNWLQNRQFMYNGSKTSFFKHAKKFTFSSIFSFIFSKSNHPYTVENDFENVFMMVLWDSKITMNSQSILLFTFPSSDRSELAPESPTYVQWKQNLIF